MRNGNTLSEVQCEQWMNLQLTLICSILPSHLWRSGDCMDGSSLLKRPACHIEKRIDLESSWLCAERGE